MRRAFSIAFAAVLFCSSSHASMMFMTRDWSVAGAGGHYGFIETEFVTLGGQHVGWETLVALGPLHVGLPCRAPVAVILCAIGSTVVACLAIMTVSGTRNHGLKDAKTA